MPCFSSQQRFLKFLSLSGQRMNGSPLTQFAVNQNLPKRSWEDWLSQLFHFDVYFASEERHHFIEVKQMPANVRLWYLTTLASIFGIKERQFWFTALANVILLEWLFLILTYFWYLFSDFFPFITVSWAIPRYNLNDDSEIQATSSWLYWHYWGYVPVV